MEKTLVLNSEKVSTPRYIGRKIAKIAISPFYRKIDKEKTSHCAVSMLVENNGKTKGLAAGVGVSVREAKGVVAGLIGSGVAKDCRGVNVAIMLALSGNVHGLSAAVFNEVGEKNNGVALGLVGVGVGDSISSWRIGDYCSKGAVIGGLYAGVHENAKGFVFGGFMTLTGKMRGIVAGLINLGESIEGLRIGLINFDIGEGHSKGLEIGLLNIKESNPWWAKVVPLFAIRLGGKKTQGD